MHFNFPNTKCVMRLSDDQMSEIHLHVLRQARLVVLSRLEPTVEKHEQSGAFGSSNTRSRLPDKVRVSFVLLQPFELGEMFGW